MDITITIDPLKREIASVPMLAAGETSAVTIEGVTITDATAKVLVFDLEGTKIAESDAIVDNAVSLDTDTVGVAAVFADITDPTERPWVAVEIKGDADVYAMSRVVMVANPDMTPQPTPVGRTYLYTDMFDALDDLDDTATVQDMLNAIKEITTGVKTGVTA